eukprot:3543382-Amphidinium_carterae.1
MMSGNLPLATERSLISALHCSLCCKRLTAGVRWSRSEATDACKLKAFKLNQAEHVIRHVTGLRL